MRTETRYTQIRYTADIYVVTGIQTAAEGIAGLEADANGTLGISTFNATTGVYTSTTTKGDITTGNPKFKISYKDGDGNITSLAEMSKDEIIVTKSAYKAPVKQVTGIGYTQAGTSLNYTTVVTGDEMILRITDTTETGAGLPYNTVLPYSYTAKAGDTVYSMLSKLVKQINDNNSFQHNEFDFIAPYNATITSTTAGAALAGGATIAAVKGATSLTTSVNHGIGVGDYVRIAGNVYQAVAGTATTTLVLDRPYEGVTATIANGTNTATQAQDLGATLPADLGLTITTTEFGETFSVALDGVLSQANQRLITRYSLGIGDGLQVSLLEAKNQYSKGYGFYNDDRTREYAAPANLANPASFYTIYRLQAKNNDIARRDRFKPNMWFCVAQADAVTPATLLDLLLP